MLYRSFKGAHEFFDKRWYIVLIAAFASVGLADITSFAAGTFLPSATTAIKSAGGDTITLKSTVLLEAALVFFASVWFKGFIGLLVKSEMQSVSLKVSRVLRRAILLFPRVFTVNLIAVMVTYASAYLALAAMTVSYAGIVLLIPAFAFSVWFSLVSPAIVIDNVRGVFRALAASRMTVRGYFWQVLFIHIIIVMPTLAMLGIDDNSSYFWPALIFINIATAIIESLLITFAYIHLRLIKKYGVDTTASAS